MDFTFRPATPEDADGIAEAHIDSIRTLGPKKYSADIVAAWGARSTEERGARILESMAKGEKFFVAVDKQDRIAGFSGYRYEEKKHRIAVYVRGAAARKKVGLNLLSVAERAAWQMGAKEIYVDASLVAEAFYARQGFKKTGEGKHTLRSGHEMPCVFMRKILS